MHSSAKHLSFCGTNNACASHFLIPFALLFQSLNFKLFDTICSVFKRTVNCLEDRLKVLDCHLELNMPHLVCHINEML